MARAGKSRLRSSGCRASADDLGRGQKLRAATGQREALAGALPENLLTLPPQSGRAPVRFSLTGSSRDLVSLMSALPPKADIAQLEEHVRFVPIDDVPAVFSRL